MPATFPANGVVVDSPTFKLFHVTLLENDAAAVATPLTFAGGGMVAWSGTLTPGGTGPAPETYIVQNVTNGVNVTGAKELSIQALTNLGFNAVNASASPGNTNVRHTFRIYMWFKNAGGI